MAERDLTLNLIGKDKSASKALKDVGEEAEKLGKKLDTEIGDGGEKASKKVREALGDVGKEARKAGDDIGAGVDRGFKKAGEGASEFKDEAKSTAREGAASFTGEFDDVADIIQETLANAFAGFGPAGMAAGMAAAFGIGMVIGELQKSAEKADEARDRMVGLAGAIREAGGDLERVDWAGQMESFAEAIGDAKEWYEVWQRDSKTNLEVIAEDTKRLGLTFEDVFKGLAGEPEALARALAEVDAKLAGANTRANTLMDSGLDPLSASVGSGASELQAYRDRLVEAQQTTERATEYAKKLTAAIGEQADAMLSASGSALALDSSILDANEAIAENGATLDTSTRAGIENRRALNDIAEAARSVTGTQAEVDAAMAKGREAFLRAARAAGMGADEANRLADELFSLPKNTNVTVKATIQDPDIRAWQTRLQARVNANPLYVPARSAAPIARASGGPVKKDTLYRVGEQGEELFVPDSDGTILNANETRRVKAGGAGVPGGSTGGAPLTAEQFETGLLRALRTVVAEIRQPAPGVRPAVAL